MRRSELSGSASSKQAKELQMLHNLRKTFIQDMNARIKNVRSIFICLF